MRAREALKSLLDPPRAAAPPRGTALLLVLALLLVDPLTYALRRISTALLPDSIAYLAMSRELLAHGRLFLEGWGHVDAGLILAPLYPALIGLWARISGDPIAAAYAVSTAAMLLAVLPLSLAGLRLGPPAFAFVAVALAQLHPAILQYGTAALSEGVFMLVLALALWAALALPLEARRWPALALGAVAGAAFLARPIGGFLWPAMIAIVAVAALDAPAPRLRRAAGDGARVTLGFVAIAGAYALALHAQSGQWPDVQGFRLQRYVVTTDAPTAGGGGGADYEAMYGERRSQRTLTADAAEMVGALLPGSGATPAPRPSLAARVGRFAHDLRVNLQYLAGSLGVPGACLLALALLTPLWPRGATARRRWTLPIVLASYLGALSLVTSVVPRYVEILAPFAFLQVLAEAHRLLAGAPWREDRSRLAALAAGLVALAALLALTLPATFRSLPLGPRIGEAGNPLADCRAALAPGAPVFAFHPLGPYLLGATWRAVPNDDFSKLRTYAARTGVAHLLLTNLGPDRVERSYYDRAPWAGDPDALAQAGLIAPACGTTDGMAMLYRLRPPGA